jgi:ribA/ribD-fused uncharacterized protein
MKYSVEQLKKEKHPGKDDFIFFWESEPHKVGIIDESCFCQWLISDFYYNDQKYTSCEQWMMAEKARLFNDNQIRSEIFFNESPDVIKKLGRKIKGFNNEKWDKYKFSIVKFGNYLKFKQDKTMLNYMLSTKNKILVEASPYDKIWGIGLSKENQDVFDVNKWQGENLLGFAIMEARDLLMENNLLDYEDFI